LLKLKTLVYFSNYSFLRRITVSDFFSFRLSEEFINEYKSKEPPFGFTDAGGNSLGEITFIRTYSRMKDDGTKERW
jgi:hypothetical protein